MASIHTRKNSPFWFCAFTVFEQTGEHDSDSEPIYKAKRTFRSTKSADKKKALAICRAWDTAARQSAKGKVTQHAREIIARGVADIALASGQALPSASVRDWCKQWLDAKAIEAEPSTLARYSGIVARWLAFLGAKANRDLAAVRAADVGAFRDKLAKELSRNSANLAVKTLRVLFNAALKQRLIAENPAKVIDPLKQRGESKRRGFTIAEIRRVLHAAGDSEMCGLVLFGLYTGQRLGDLSRLTWRNVDLNAGEVAFTTRKTGRRLVLPLAKPLRDYLTEVPSADDPNAPIFPTVAKADTSTLSRQFHDLLASVGMATPWTHRANGKGRNVSRAVGELSFHSLRHSATTLLKASGVSEAVAMAIIGHDTAAISRGYTHLSTDDLRDAVDKLPDVTKSESKTGVKVKL